MTTNAPWLQMIHELRTPERGHDAVGTEARKGCSEPPQTVDKALERLTSAIGPDNGHDGAFAADLRQLIAAYRERGEALARIATVDMGGGFLGAEACRKVARAALDQRGE